MGSTYKMGRQSFILFAKKTGRLKESYSVMSTAYSIVQFSHMCCGRSPISHMHELHIGAGINGKTCEG